MKQKDGFDWLDEVQRKHFEPKPSFRTLMIEGLLWVVAVGALGYTLGKIA